MLERAYPERISAALGGQRLLGQRSKQLTADQKTMLEATQLQLIEEIFFASLATEEGRHARVSLVFIDDMEAASKVFRDYRWQIFTLAEPKPYDLEHLAKLTSLCQPGESYLVVTGYGDDMQLVALSGPPLGFEWWWTGAFPTYLRITATGPGALVLEKGNREILRTRGGVILKAPPPLFQLGSWQEASTSCPPLEHIRQGLGSNDSDYDAFGRLILRLMGAIEAAGLGGMMLIQAGSEPCLEVDTPSYQFVPAIDMAEPLKDYIEALYEQRNAAHEMSQATGDQDADEQYRKANEALNTADQVLTRMAEIVARMALVDGAVVLSSSLQTLGFGAKISVPDAWIQPPILEVVHHEREQWKPFDLSRRGTRHRAAVCFAHADPGNLALIVSHDGAAAAILREGDQVLYWPIYLKAHWAGSGPNDF